MKKYESFSKEELIHIINSSLSKREVYNKLGYKGSNQCNQIINEIAEKYMINIDHLSNRYIENLLGKKFDKLTVLSYNGSINNNHTWLCRCSCLNNIVASTSQLKSLQIHQCSKCARKQNGESHRKDLSNQRFGKLVAKKVNEKITQEKKKCGESHVYWDCVCDCGNICTYASYRLLRGEALSCGCIQSSGEYLLARTLSELKINFQQQYSFKDLVGDKKPLRFDFAIIRKNHPITLIECQGQEHNSPIEFWGGEEKFLLRQKYDQLKKEYCQLHNYPLIYIPYQDYPKINQSYILNKIMEVEE